jgi:DNA-binding MarR family transcriptional regulator
MTKTKLHLDDFLPFRLSIASNTVSERIAQVYQSVFGLTIAEWRVIAVLAESSPLTQQAICARTSMDKVTISRAAIALDSRKLIIRTPHKEDKRAHLLSLSLTGETLYANVAPKALEMERTIFECFTSEERALLKDLLRRIERFSE